MDVINYHPWTMIYLNLPPSIGLVANWTHWSAAETKLIQQVKIENPHDKLTILNFILPKMSVPIVSIEGLKSLGERQGISRILNYSVPKQMPIIEKDNDRDLNNFEPLKSMMHLNKIYVLQNHPLLKQLKRLYKASQIIIVKPDPSKEFLNQLKRDLNQGNLNDYRKLVGGNYSFKEPVIHGTKNGSKIGFPTANMLIKPPLPIKTGVYLVKLSLPNETQKRWGLGDYRKLPNNDWLFETFILDFNQDIYGWVITVELVEFYRSNVPIKNLEQLKSLIKSDEIALRKMIKKIEEK